MTETEELINLIKIRENTLFAGLGKALKGSQGKEGLFQTWMYKQNENIQNAGKTYGERIVAEEFRLVVERTEVRELGGMGVRLAAMLTCNGVYYVHCTMYNVHLSGTAGSNCRGCFV